MEETIKVEIEGEKNIPPPDESQIIKERKEKVVSFFKKKYSWISYVILAVIVWIAVRIRTGNLDGLRDVSTGQWTLGPDLDPFLFLRWAKHIVENGSLMAVDTLRNVPLGFETRGELILHPYLIAWFHKIASIFGSSSVEQSAAVFPAFMFALTVIAFFFLVRKIFIDELGEMKSSIVALISSFFLTVIPSLLPRTVAGIPEKESSGFLFLFLAFYLFLTAWRSKSKKGQIIYSILAGVSTAGMALIWGGFVYIFITLALVTMIAFILGHINKNKLYVYGIWLVSSVFLMSLFSTRYSVVNILVSATTGISVLVLLILIIHFLIFNTKLRRYFEIKYFTSIPKPIISIAFTVIIILIITPFVFGPGFILDKVNSVVGILVTPVTDRLGVTVAENRQPYFGEWSSSFGPTIRGIPILFWLFFIGSVYLFFNMVRPFKIKERFYLTLSYLIFLTAIIFSRYARGSTLNGENFASLLLYFGGIIIFLSVLGFYYYRYYFNDKSKLKEINFNLIFIFTLFFFSIVSARGAVRLIMVLVPAASIIVGYFVVSTFSRAKKIREINKKWVVWPLVAIIILSTLFAGYEYYKVSSGTAKNYIPSSYNQQWQRTMSWVRDNTQENAVFGHWWDYGYWIQTIGQRATVLDGGNAISYWNHLMGRYALTGTNNNEALEFLYAHNTTHFLIDSTDIGKYAAFSSIGSDKDYDRRSWINTFLKDNSQVFEAKNRTISVFRGGFTLDEDIVYGEGESKIFLPGVNGKELGQTLNVAGIGGIRVEVGESGDLVGTTALFVYQGSQYEIPIKYAYYDGEFIEFDDGLEAGVFFMPRITQTSGGVQLEKNGALLYLSKRTVKSQLVRLYLYDEDNDSFKLAYTEDDQVISSLESQGLEIGDFAYFQGIRGPIKIWEITYPEDIKFKEEFIDVNYPEELRRV